MFTHSRRKAAAVLVAGTAASTTTALARIRAGRTGRAERTQLPTDHRETWLCQHVRMDEHTGDLPGSPPAGAPKVTAGPRRRLVWLIVAAALVLGAGIGAGATYVLLRDDEDPANKPWVPPAADSPSLGGNEYSGADAIQRYCLDLGGRQTVIAYFDGDDPDLAMRQAVEALDEDDRIDRVTTETRQEAYERFTEIFADQPELLEMARPEALPASVTLLPADDVYPGDLADAITDEFSTIDSVSAGCELPE
jgi:hypothetical protein